MGPAEGKQSARSQNWARQAQQHYRSVPDSAGQDPAGSGRSLNQVHRFLSSEFQGTSCARLFARIIFLNSSSFALPRVEYSVPRPGLIARPTGSRSPNRITIDRMKDLFLSRHTPRVKGALNLVRNAEFELHDYAVRLAGLAPPDVLKGRLALRVLGR